MAGVGRAPRHPVIAKDIRDLQLCTLHGRRAPAERRALGFGWRSYAARCAASPAC